MEAYLPALGIFLLYFTFALIPTNLVEAYRLLWVIFSSLNYLLLGDNRTASLRSRSLFSVLSLDNNQLSGNIPDSLGNLSLLGYLGIANNQLRGSIPSSLGNLFLLEHLVINNNQLSGGIPSSFVRLSSLTHLYADANPFNETISSSSLPASLHYLSLSLNHHQSISETFFHNLTSLEYLYLSDCVLNISTTWIPPFQLSELYLVSCMIDSEFPSWISTQFSLESLELSNASLIGVIPYWILGTNSLLKHLNLSGNHLQGRLSSNNSIMHLEELDLSGNSLSGYIPSMWPANISLLLFNDNLFSGNIPLILGQLSKLWLLNLANNNITGVIPAILSNCSSLMVLNLGNNSLDGGLPHEFSKLSKLSSLVVHSNKLNGLFPWSIENCSNLQVLDIGNNLFEGEIPALIGNLSNLRVLAMKKNKFIGNIPSEIGQLKKLQILILSSNHISGSIPHTIISLQAMTSESQDGSVLSISGGSYKKKKIYKDPLDIISKGRDEHYKYILSTLTSIDLSNNELEGAIALDFGNWKGLKFLNLSMNNLNGTIPSSLGGIGQLESLDLSRNKFSGQIPLELDFLHSLGFLDLSNNHLSGSIPQGRHITTFNESCFSQNPNLWGCPLPKKCSWPQFVLPPPIPVNKEKQNTKDSWYGIALGLSYGVSFGGVVSLILIKISWRRICFNKIDTILKFMFPWMKNLRL
ncbi:receptor-like protein EIX1 isoform X1 [Cryptomeria japonica]|uniref:receptor-like protein EIX1 isoform X1 n=1 Tax=Cryptomeria japonica TaxID=3369 RepID=UPI0027DAAA60|nr:receptor-like protein EIX1 isoform X1 [Cryptomeria japonica]